MAHLDGPSPPSPDDGGSQWQRALQELSFRWSDPASPLHTPQVPLDEYGRYQREYWDIVEGLSRLLEDAPRDLGRQERIRRQMDLTFGDSETHAFRGRGIRLFATTDAARESLQREIHGEFIERTAGLVPTLREKLAEYLEDVRKLGPFTAEEGAKREELFRGASTLARTGEEAAAAAKDAMSSASAAARAEYVNQTTSFNEWLEKAEPGGVPKEYRRTLMAREEKSLERFDGRLRFEVAEMRERVEALRRDFHEQVAVLVEPPAFDR